MSSNRKLRTTTRGNGKLAPVLIAIAVVSGCIAIRCGSGHGGASPTAFDPRQDPRLAGVRADWTEFESNLLGDGDVTDTEYEEAVLAALACLDDAGLPHSAPTPDQSQGYMQYGYRVGPWPDADEAAAVSDACETEYLDDVSIVWALQHEEPEAVREARKQALLDCVRAAGIDAPDYVTYRDSIENGLLGDEREVAAACREIAFAGPPPD